MVKKRTKKSEGVSRGADDFIQGAQVKTVKNSDTVNPYDPKESRTTKVKGKSKPHKTIGLQFNRYEWWELEKAAEKTKRSANSIIREGIIKELNSIKES